MLCLLLFQVWNNLRYLLPPTFKGVNFKLLDILKALSLTRRGEI